MTSLFSHRSKAQGKIDGQVSRAREEAEEDGLWRCGGSLFWAACVVQRGPTEGQQRRDSFVKFGVKGWDQTRIRDCQ